MSGLNAHVHPVELLPDHLIDAFTVRNLDVVHKLRRLFEIGRPEIEVGLTSINREGSDYKSRHLATVDWQSPTGLVDHSSPRQVASHVSHLFSRMIGKKEISMSDQSWESLPDGKRVHDREGALRHNRK